MFGFEFVRKEKRPGMEFSKKILIAMFIITLIIVACAIAMSYMTQTTDVYAYLIPSIFVELSVGTGFYYKKAQAENLLKIEQGFEDEHDREDEFI